jgi:hypothetical protein
MRGSWGDFVVGPGSWRILDGEPKQYQIHVAPEAGDPLNAVPASLHARLAKPVHKVLVYDVDSSGELTDAPVGMADLMSESDRNWSRRAARAALRRLEGAASRNSESFSTACFLWRIALTDWTPVTEEGALRGFRATCAKLTSQNGDFGQAEYDSVWKKAGAAVKASDDPWVLPPWAYRDNEEKCEE